MVKATDSNLPKSVSFVSAGANPAGVEFSFLGNLCLASLVASPDYLS